MYDAYDAGNNISEEFYMKKGIRIVFLIHIIVALFFGVVLTFLPGIWANIMNWQPLDTVMTRLVGATMLAFAVGSALGFTAKRWEQVRIVVLMEIALTVVGLLVGLYEALFAGAPVSIWINTILFGIFAVAWICVYIFGGKEATVSD